MKRMLATYAAACLVFSAACGSQSGGEDGDAQSDEIGPEATDDGDAGAGDTLEDDASHFDGADQEDPDIPDDPEEDAADDSPSDMAGDDAGGEVIEGTNPVIDIDHPDPHVMRVVSPDGKPVYYLTSTVHNTGDIPIFTSRDLVHWAEDESTVFDRTRADGASLDINGDHYCSIWAPQLVQLGPGSFMVSFSAARFSSAQASCPAYAEDGGVYLAWSSSPLGPFAPATHSWEPLPAGGHITDCLPMVRDAIPHSVDYASPNCQSNYCHKIIRLDSDVFHDEHTGRWWLAYSWYTNSPPMVPWEQDNYGEHVGIVELDPEDPFAVICDEEVPQIHAGNPHDGDTLQALEDYCPRCGEMLSMTRGRFDEEMMRYGYSWGVVEGANMFRRGGYIYLLLSGSAWDSAYYHVFWVAAPTVAGLACDNPDRLEGRYLIPSEGDAFGHGTAVLGPDGESWYFVHHRLISTPCKELGYCPRDVWVSPLEFEDRGDDLGDVYIKPRFPAEDPSIRVVLP